VRIAAAEVVWAVVQSHLCRDEAASWMGHPQIAVVLAKKKLWWAIRPSVFFISTICLRACSVLIHTMQRPTP
jgi:hypothetical protein